MKFGIIPEITNEMRAAGLEAWDAAWRDCLTKAQTLDEIYYAMAGMYLIQLSDEHKETLH